MTPKLYGYMATFLTAEELLRAAQMARREGYRRVQAYTPFPIEGLAEAVGFRFNVLPWLMLLGGLSGGSAGYYMLWYACTISYRLNIGGRPLNSWPSFVPITFELTVLSASLTGFFAVFLLSGLPRLYHPVFNAEEFKHETSGRFFLCIEATDRKFETRDTWQFLGRLKPVEVIELDD
jgi:hypothetical protein